MLLLNPTLTGAKGSPFCSLLLSFPTSALTVSMREPPSPFVLIVERKRNNNKRPYSVETTNEEGSHDNPKAGKNCGPIL